MVISANKARVPLERRRRVVCETRQSLARVAAVICPDERMDTVGAVSRTKRKGVWRRLDPDGPGTVMYDVEMAKSQS